MYNIMLIDLPIYGYISTDRDDYRSRIQIITFNSNENTHSVRIPILDDTIAETLERFSVILLPTVKSTVLLTDRGQATVEVIDNDCKWSIYCKL